MGVYVKLLEYDNIDGMILLSELSRRRIRSMQKLVRVGNNEVVVVIRVDKDKGPSLLVLPFVQLRLGGGNDTVQDTSISRSAA